MPHANGRAADEFRCHIRPCFVAQSDRVIGSEVGIGIACVVNTCGVIFAVEVTFFVGYGEIVPFGVCDLIDRPNQHLILSLRFNARIACGTVFHDQTCFGPYFKGFWCAARAARRKDFGKRFVFCAINRAIFAIIALYSHKKLAIEAELIIIVKVDAIYQAMLCERGGAAANR